jgi:hypothetical protein
MNCAEQCNCGTFEQLSRRLYRARQEAKQAKEAVRQLAAKIGNCEMRAEPGEAGLKCYHSSRPKEQWCNICKQKLPAWEAYHEKTNTAAGALRALLRAASKE